MINCIYINAERNKTKLTNFRLLLKKKKKLLTAVKCRNIKQNKIQQFI